MAIGNRILTLTPLVALLASCQAIPTALPQQFSAMAIADGTPSGLLLVVERAGTQAYRRPHAMREVESIPELGLSAVVPTGDESLQQLSAELGRDPSVALVETDRWMDMARPRHRSSRKRPSPKRHPRKPGGGSGSDPGTDPGVPYTLQHIHAQGAWATAQGQGATIAVVDSGVDAGHPDLAANLLSGYDATGHGDVTDQNGHGTHVAGLAAARPDPGLGIGGVAPMAKILPVKVMDPDGEGRVLWVARGIVWAADHGASVINLSLGGPRDSRVLDLAIRHAIQKGIPVVVAMGNDGDDGNPKEYPACEPGVIAVGATDDNDQVTSFSDYGPWISLVAPGYADPSSFPTYPTTLLSAYQQEPSEFPPEDRMGEGSALLSGTSQATPLVSGTVALLKGLRPDLSPEQIRKILMDSAAPMGSGADEHHGAGLLDVQKAVQEVQAGGRTGNG